MNNTWSTPTTIRSQLLKRWKRGDFLAAQITAEALFPLHLQLKRPNSRDLGEQFEAAQQWIQQLQQQEAGDQRVGYRIQWQSINHRQVGRNEIPVAVWFEREQDLLSTIGKQREAARFHTLSSELLVQFPELREWVIRYPHKLIQFETGWPRLLKVVAWIQAHPRPHCYLRQVDLAGVDTKFIEQHRALLSELLDIVLPAEQVDTDARGVRAFEQRYGFTPKPTPIRFRILDPTLAIAGLTDISIPVEQFAELQVAVEHVFITENEINGLAFPPYPKSLVIFGLGYGLQLLQQVEWLKQRSITYWGDIDTHGFAMLEQVRHYLPQTHSILMERQTLLDHRAFWGEEQTPTQRTLPLLTEEEQALYQLLLKQELAPQLRLEQERIGYTSLCQALSRLQNPEENG